MALIISVAAFAYDAATEGVQYDGNDWKVKVVGLSNGKVAVLDIKLDAEETSITIPATFHAQWNHGTEAVCDLYFEVEQVGNGSWAIYVERNGESFLPSVTSLTISEGITTIAANAFSSATSLTSIYFNGATAPSIGEYAFPSDILSSCPAYVTTWEAKESVESAGFYNVKYHNIDLWENWYGDYDWHNSHLVDLTLHRTFLAANGWYTICLPANISDWNITHAFGEGVEVMELTSSARNGDELQLTFSDSHTWMSACKPYLVRVAADVENPTFLGVSFDNTASTTTSTTYADMVGSFETMDLDNTMHYLGPNNYLYQPATSVSMAGYRAYFVLRDAPAGAPARIVFHDNAATAVDELQQPDAGAQKLLRDGQLLIQRGGQYYTIDGRIIR